MNSFKIESEINYSHTVEPQPKAECTPGRPCFPLAWPGDVSEQQKEGATNSTAKLFGNRPLLRIVSLYLSAYLNIPQSTPSGNSSIPLHLESCYPELSRIAESAALYTLATAIIVAESLHATIFQPRSHHKKPPRWVTAYRRCWTRSLDPRKCACSCSVSMLQARQVRICPTAHISITDRSIQRFYTTSSSNKTSLPSPQSASTSKPSRTRIQSSTSGMSVVKTRFDRCGDITFQACT